MTVCLNSLSFKVEYTRVGVGGKNEGLQISSLGILFQRLHHNNTKFCTKNQVLSFLVVKFYHFYCQRHKVLISAKNNDILPNYCFHFLRKNFTTGSIVWISRFAIFSGPNFLKFCKKELIPSDVSIKLLPSAKPTISQGINQTL